MWRCWLPVAAVSFATGCAALAGLDDDYIVGSAPSGSLASGGAAGHGAQGGFGAAAGQGGTTTGTGVGLGGAGGGLAEDCLNGIDDDGDLAIDCADSECTAAGYLCVPAAAGATGHVALVGSAAACAVPGVVTYFTSCSDCDCTEVGGTCSVQLSVWYAPGCGGAGQALKSGCNTQTVSVDPTYLVSTTSALGDGTCTQQAAQVPATETAACEVASPGSCDDGSACVPPSFGAVTACVLLPPSTPCPSEYPEPRPVSVGGSTCDCSCQQGSQQCGTVSVTSYAAKYCTGTSSTVPITAPCTYAGLPPSVDVPATVPATIDCAASGTVADPVSTATLCCQS